MIRVLMGGSLYFGFKTVKISIPPTIKIELISRALCINSPYGTTLQYVPKEILLIKKNNILILISTINNVVDKFSKILKNFLYATSKIYKFDLELRGVGYRARIHENKLILTIGLTHTVSIVIPCNLQIKIRKKRFFRLYSSNYEQLRGLCRYIQMFHFPDIYKGKGIRKRRIFIKLRKINKK